MVPHPNTYPIQFNRADFRDRVYACWLGKNIGGTMGTPYEGTREILDIKGFVTKPNEVLPNDDLDLQLVWLHAIRKVGPYDLTASKLGEFWASYIVPFWNEYGIGKVNMQRGLLPPLSGAYHNPWKHSNGAWIRTEIWASLAPGNPELAAHYAIEDAMVDHGDGEGTIAAAFVAAMQSAAFALHDLRVIIDIALSKIPADSRMAKSIRAAVDCYDAKIPPMEAREKIRLMNADIGDGWFEAPSNVAYAVLGLLYGEGDFKKSMITAIDCGDDTDCTGATVGATLGIMNGTAGIPADWKQYIGDNIVTVSLNRGVGGHFPTTCTELTDMVVEQTPIVLASYQKVHASAYSLKIGFTDGKTELPDNLPELYKGMPETLNRLKSLNANSFETYFGPMTATVTYDRVPDIRPNETIGLHLHIENRNLIHGNMLFNVNVRWLTPDGFTVDGPRALTVGQRNAHSTNAADADYVITVGDSVAPVNRLVLELTAETKACTAYVPVVLIG